MHTFFSIIECQVNFAMDCIRSVIETNSRSIDVKQSAYDRYQALLAHYMPRAVFSGSCQSWYKNAKGVIFALWPSDCTHFWWKLKSFDMDDFVYR